MKKTGLIFFMMGLLVCGTAVFSQEQDNCSSFLVTKAASSDGSVMITYTCDGEFLPHLEIIPSADHGPDDYMEIRGRDGQILGKINLPAGG